MAGTTDCGSDNVGTTILETYGSALIPRPQDVILHIECGSGKRTRENLIPFFGQYKQIIGIDSSEELISNARKAKYWRECVEYYVLDITRNDLVKNFRIQWKEFTKVFCFSCVNWMFDFCNALANIQRLMAENGECFFAFVGSSPVYNTYRQLAESPAWAPYMLDYAHLIPFTHIVDSPDAPFSNMLRDAGFEVVTCKSFLVEMVPNYNKATLKEYIEEVNVFTRRIPKGSERSNFTRDCWKFLRGNEEDEKMSHKLIIAHVRCKITKLVRRLLPPPLSLSSPDTSTQEEDPVIWPPFPSPLPYSI